MAEGERLVPPEKPTPMIPQRGPDEGYDWDRPDVLPAVPEEPVRMRCPVHTHLNEPCPICESYIAAGL